jgi:cytochrome c oxidase subunit II
MIRKSGVAVALATLFSTTAVWAAANVPQPWQLGLQPSASERMTDIVNLHDFLLWIIAAVSGFVLLLLIWIAIRYNARSNPIPSATAHNTVLEVLWTIIPVIILVVIAIPSFRLLYFEDTIPKADLTIKAIGRQWYWSYEYPDNGNFAFDAQMLDDAKAHAANEPRLLGTDNHVVVPVGQIVRVLTTGADVIHSWALPAFGVKIDAVPGRINETWFKAEREGIFYGECSELCGARHSYMPIEVEVVSKERFAQWVAEARHKFAATDGTQDTRLAAAH